MSEKSKKMSIEESLDYLDEIVKKLEDPDIALEDSFSLYEKGMRVLKETTKAVDEVEKRVRLIDEDGNMEEFDE